MLVFLGSRSASAQAASTARSAFAHELSDSVTAILVDAVADSAFPGAFAVVGDQHGTLAEVGVGQLDWNGGGRPDAHTIWDLASLTKIVATTTALAQLVELGAVGLDVPVQRYLPDWTGAGKESVTVRHLLTHTAGLPAFRNYDQQTHDPDSLATLLYATPLERPAGERMVYSDIGAFVMGRIIERVTGGRLDSYVTRHILAPLRMSETMFNPPDSLLPRIAPTEYSPERGGLLRGKVHDERAYYLGGVAAHAGLFSSGADLARFAEAMLDGGALEDARILASGTVARFTAYADSTASNRALGWQKPERPGMRDHTPGSSWSGRYMTSRAFGHTGFTGTSIAVDPELGVWVVLLTNRVNPTRKNGRIVDVRAHLADAVVTTTWRHRSIPLPDTPQ